MRSKVVNHSSVTNYIASMQELITFLKYLLRPQFVLNKIGWTMQSRLCVILCSKGCIGLETDRIDTNKSFGIGGIVIKGIAPTFDIHGCQIGIVQGLGAGSSLDDTVALVEFDFDLSDDVTLGKIERVADQFHLGSEPKPVVTESGKFIRKTFGEALDLTVHADAFQVHVRFSQEGSTGCFIHPTGLDTNKAVLDNIDATDSMLSGNHVAVEEDFEGIGFDGSVRLVGDLDWHSLQEFDDHSLRVSGAACGETVILNMDSSGPQAASSK